MAPDTVGRQRNCLERREVRQADAAADGATGTDETNAMDQAVKRRGGAGECSAETEVWKLVAAGAEVAGEWCSANFASQRHVRAPRLHD